MRNSLAGTKVSEGGGQVLRVPEQKSLAACEEAPGGAGCPPAAHGSHMEQISTLQPPRGGAPAAAGGCGLEEAAAHGEPPQQEQGVWGELPPTRGGPVLEQFAPGGWMDPVVRSHVGAINLTISLC